MKKNHILRNLVLASVLCCFTGLTFAQEPIQITDVAGLRALRTDDAEAADKSYILMNDIDLNGETWLEEELPWSFKGTFDGNGFVIKNFTFNGNVTNPIGFFRHLRGTVKNLGFENASVNGKDKDAGVIVGKSIGGNIINCFVKNSEVNGTNENKGAITGNAEEGGSGNYITIKNCYVINTSVTATNGRAGAITGRAAQTTTIDQCYADECTVYGGQDVGGMVGRLATFSTLSDSYTSNTTVSGNDNTGGLVGRLWGATVTDCYSSAHVTSRSFQAGGLVGQTTDEAGSVLNSYFSGILVRNGTNRAGGIMALAGVNDIVIQNCANLAAEVISDEKYRVVSLSGRNGTLENNFALSTFEITHGNAAENGTDVTPERAKEKSFFETDLTWNFTDNWLMLPDGYPVLKWQTLPVNVTLSGVKDTYILQSGNTIDLNEIKSLRGLNLTFNKNNDKITINNNVISLTTEINAPESVTVTISADENYNITNNTLTIQLMPTGAIKIAAPADLALVTSNPTMDFELQNNIDMTGVEFTGLCSDISPFSGSFDGKGFIIKGLKINNSTANGIGFFRETKNATIKNLGLENIDFYGNNDIGGIVGIANGGIIEKCYVSNSSINGADRAAGIAARVSGGITITDCYVIADITGRDHQLGGIAGASFDNGATIRNCYFAGELKGGGHAGSMLGLIDRDGMVTIENSMNIATSITGREPYRICNWSSRSNYAQFTNNYSISTTTGNKTDDDNRNGTTIKEDTDVKQMTFYSDTLHWNTDTWTLLNGYPVLKWQATPINIQLKNMKNNYVLNPGETINMNAEYVSMNGAELTFTSNNANLVINDANIATASTDITELEDVTVTITAAHSTIADNIIRIKLMPAGVIRISTPDDLALVTSNPSRDFELANDIDMTDVDFSGLCTNAEPFTGTFNGKGFVIKNVHFSDEEAVGMGLFIKTEGAKIMNLGLENISFSGKENIGGISGESVGDSILQCYVANCDITAADRAAGIAAKVLGGTRIIDCYVSGNITGTAHQAGGIAAASFNGGIEIKNCYFTGNLQAGGHTGAMLGLIDADDDAYVINCINLAQSINGPNAYRICSWAGRIGYAQFTNNYSISTTTGNNNDDDDRNGTELNDNSYAKLYVFYADTLNWDTDNVWYIAEGNEFPVLRQFGNYPSIINKTEAEKQLNYLFSDISGQEATVSLSKEYDYAFLHIYSITGTKLIDTQAVNGSVINVGHLPHGIYMYTLLINNNIVGKGKLIK